MYSTNNKTDKFTAIAKIGGTCITITIWCIVGVWIYLQTTKPTETQPQPQPVETVNDSAETPTQPTAKSDLDIESFKPQLNESTWGEVEDIIKSFEAKMRECEGFDGENKTACYNHYKTEFWKKMRTTASEKN
jgi:hypothetical protein